MHKLSFESKNKAAAGKSCYHCGKTGHQASECWCKDLDCRRCGKKGHIERACKNKKTVNDGEAGPLQEILKKHSKVFDGELGSMKDITVKLTIKPGSTPKCLKAGPVPYAIKPKVEAELDRLALAPRICGDFKVTVNPVLTAEQYPLPLIDDLFSCLAGGQKFSKVDLCQAYFQMHVYPVTGTVTIVTHKGLYRYRRLPFGITSAPALFQRAMAQILSGLPGVQCYLDDQLITGPDEQSHLRILDATLQRLQEYGLKVWKDKCEFFQHSVEYLGHVIDSAGLHKAPSMVKAIVEAPSRRM